MNKSLLIIICDFLLLSLLALARFDEGGVGQSQTQPQIGSNPSSGVPDAERDLVDVMATALEEERRSREELLRSREDLELTREQLQRELARAQQNVQSREAMLAEREKRIRNYEEKIETFQRNLRQKEAEAERLDRERALLQMQFASTQTNINRLQAELNNTAVQAQLSQQQLEAMQAELRARQAETQRLQEQLQVVEKSRQATETEKHALATQLQVSETEKRMVLQQLQDTKTQVEIVREEKQQIQQHANKLAEGVSTLAESSRAISNEVTQLAVRSEELTQEIRDYRPQTANAIFSEFVANRVQAHFKALRTGFLNREVNSERETKTVLISDGKKIYALYHVQDTPLTFRDPGVDWNWLTGTLRRKSAAAPVEQMSFLAIDPRIVIAPVQPGDAQMLGSKVYPIASEPYRFQEAVLVGSREEYYGECKFRIDATLPNFVRMDRSMFRGLFGRFNPSTGDLVFTKTGELLGLMVNNEYCALVDNLMPVRTIRLGTDIADQHTGLVLSEMWWRISRLPFKLQ